jgi:hypothetical protein
MGKSLWVLTQCSSVNFTDVSEERIASVFRVEKVRRKTTRIRRHAGLPSIELDVTTQKVVFLKITIIIKHF